VTKPRTVPYDITLNTTTGQRHHTGTATTYGHPTDDQTRSAIAQHHQAGTSTPVAAVNLHNAPQTTR
jgi:hypothetical protein